MFVQDVIAYGDTAGNRPRQILASIFEKAFVSPMREERRACSPTEEHRRKLSAITILKISMPGIPDVNIGINRHIKSHRSAVSGSSSGRESASSPETRRLQPTAMKTLQPCLHGVQPDENGGLISPWGRNRSDGSGDRTGATATMSWEEFANYGTTVRVHPAGTHLQAPRPRTRIRISSWPSSPGLRHPWFTRIAYAWPGKKKPGDACQGRYYVTQYDKQRSISLGTLRWTYGLHGQHRRVSMGQRNRLFRIVPSVPALINPPLGRQGPPSGRQRHHRGGSAPSPSRLTHRHRLVH